MGKLFEEDLMGQKYGEETRTCLRCGTNFLSKWVGERVCEHCKRSTEWMTQGATITYQGESWLMSGSNIANKIASNDNRADRATGLAQSVGNAPSVEQQIEREEKPLDEGTL